ncbi:hypothetical protein LC087_02875 [Bacillus carboniphilus]|uniref:Lipoprotein n=1 Tax=Bacillus carboniphilus TaxID=86663 RepID=A0ABY9JWK8_9BACI|nr:hypothetical protein [Bacillus carboniphilus]WLR43163.1 hypothetical protein LC087_02875 [Bacillus carboniphilus]
MVNFKRVFNRLGSFLNTRMKIGVLFGCILFLTGCFLREAPTSLIQEPTIPEEQQRMITQIKKGLPEGVELLTANKDPYPKTYYSFDLNGDKRNEVLVFYRVNKPDEPSINMAIFENSLERRWVMKEKITFKGTDLDYVEVKQLKPSNSGQNIPQLIIGTKKAGLGSLYIFKSVDGVLKNIVINQSYDHFLVDDLNRDNVLELHVVEGQKLKMYQLNDQNQLVVLSEVFLDPNVIYEKMTIGQVVKGVKAIFLDVKDSEKRFYTQVVTLTDQQLVKRIPESHKKNTYKDRLITSKDIDNDGIIEIASTKPFKSEQEGLEGHYYETYMKLTPEYSSFEEVDRRYLNLNKGFYIIINDEWVGELKITEKSNFVVIENQEGWKTSIEWRSNKLEGAQLPGTLIGESEEWRFYIQKDAGVPDLMESFHLMSEDI